MLYGNNEFEWPKLKKRIKAYTKTQHTYQTGCTVNNLIDKWPEAVRVQSDGR